MEKSEKYLNSKKIKLLFIGSKTREWFEMALNNEIPNNIVYGLDSFLNDSNYDF